MHLAMILHSLLPQKVANRISPLLSGRLSGDKFGGTSDQSQPKKHLWNIKSVPVSHQQSAV